MPEFLQPLLGPNPRTAAFLLAGVLFFLLTLLLALWQLFGRGPRRRRAFHRAQALLHQKAWKEALGIVHGLQAGGRLSKVWQGKLRNAEGECHRVAGSEFLLHKDYEPGLEHLLKSAELLNLNAAEVRSSVIGTMVGEVRRLFAATVGPDTEAVHGLIARTLLLQSPCPEASFWQALCHAREGKPDLALSTLRDLLAEEAKEKNGKRNGKRFLDPPLYYGALLLQQGQAKEALRYFAEANRIDSGCPFVAALTGTGMIQAGGDVQIAVKVLQRTLTGPRGFPLWKQSPQRAYVEGFPESASYVRRLASQHNYVCPLWGADLQPLLRQANTALGQGLYRLGNYQESADVFNRLLQESAPSVAVLRGLGLALTRLERYDQAFKHLRAAHELNPEDRLTAGYLALCGARGKPTRPEDKVNNVAWAVWLVGKFDAPGDAEWAGLLSDIFAEARQAGVPVAAPDQVRLCEQLRSVDATDPQAAEAYHHLQASAPEVVLPEHAWLYCRAAQLHRHSGEHTLELFARTFADQAAARTFYEQRQWDFEEIEYTYLERAAEREPGHFPAALGPDYPARGEQLLTARLEGEARPEAALAAAEVWLKLAPASPRAHDGLAQLYYRRGDLDRALQLLQDWNRLEPADPLPLLRQAVIYQQSGDVGRCTELIRWALDLTQGRLRAEVAFLGARLTLAWLLGDCRLQIADCRLKEAENGTGGATPADNLQSTICNLQSPGGSWKQALEFLEEGLRQDPHHLQALWCRAAVRSLLGDQEALAGQAPAMERPDVGDARYQYMTAVCHLAGGNYAGVIEACQRAAGDPAYAVESAYLMGWAYIHRRDPATAAMALQRVGQAQDSPSAPFAQAILGAIRFHQGGYDEAIRWWQQLPAERRAGWHFHEPLSATVFLAALVAFQEGRYAQAAERLREAGRLGLRDRRLGPLLALALFKAGQQLLYNTAVAG